MSTTLYGAALAEAYDALNDGIDYEKICDFLLECVKKHSDIEVKDICEAACGTGSMACALARRGYHVVASDISEDMLSAADRKANAQDLPIRFVLQDMRRSVMYAQKDLYLCLLDSMNYLLTKDDILSALTSAKDCLKPGGLFIFDMNSKKKFETVYAQNDYVLETDDVYCGWENEYNEKSRICRFYLSIFRENADGTYTRADEEQREKMYTVRQMKRYIEEAGFTLCAVYGDAVFAEGDEMRDERLYYVLKKEENHE